MYTLVITLTNKETVSIGINSFSVSSSEQDLALGDAAIGGLYCVIIENDIDKYFSLVQKNVDTITIYQLNEENNNESIYTSTYWDRIISLQGSYVPAEHQIVSTLRIGHMFKEDK